MTARVRRNYPHGARPHREHRSKKGRKKRGSQSSATYQVVKERIWKRTMEERAEGVGC